MYSRLYSEFKSAIETVPQMKTEFPEVEIRFGYLNNGVFDASLPEHIFNALLDMFRTGKLWDAVYTEKSVDYFRKTTRLSVTPDGTHLCIKKVKFGSIDIKNDVKNSTDVRLSISTETPCDIPSNVSIGDIDEESFDTKREKVRHTFIYKGIWKYDFTIVNSETYEFEIEMINPKATLKIHTSNYLSQSLTMKVRDVVNKIDEYIV